MARKPYVMYEPVKLLSIHDRRDQVTYNTYREIKKNIKLLINNSYDGLVCVYRERRGEWGEWFEHWRLQNNKPVITKSGWM